MNKYTNSNTGKYSLRPHAGVFSKIVRAYVDSSHAQPYNGSPGF